MELNYPNSLGDEICFKVSKVKPGPDVDGENGGG